MFIPRALRLKGVKERPKETTSASGERPAKKARIKISPGAIDEANTSRELDQQEQNDTRPARGPTFTTPQVTHEFLGWLVAGMEMIFSDYAYQAEEGAAWLEKHYREVDREGKCKTFHFFPIPLNLTDCNALTSSSHSPFSDPQTSIHLVTQQTNCYRSLPSASFTGAAIRIP